MQLRSVRRWLVVAALAAPAPLAGCAAFGLGTPQTLAPAVTAPSPGASWMLIQQGTATPTASPTRGVPLVTATPGAGFVRGAAGCPADWSGEQVLIPLTVTTGVRSVTATWPRRGAGAYRIAAVPQKLVSGSQPAVVWHDVPAVGGCTATATISGLTSKAAYIVWLDAPNTGTWRDGDPHPYHGRSGVIHPG
jgi:hypothetical protein